MTTLNRNSINGTLHRGDKGGYAIVADDYPIFAFGKSVAIAHARFVKACHAYGDVDAQQTISFDIGSSTSIVQPIYGTSFMR